MRVKTFTAPTNSQAMELVRLELGDEAIIISTGTTEDGDGVLVVAAIDVASTDEIENVIDQEPERLIDLDTEETVRQALVFHGVPPRLVSRLASIAAKADAPNPTLALAAAIDAAYDFSILDLPTAAQPIMLVGPPGCGKTITAAKLCTQARLAKREVTALSCDTQRAGGIEQFKAFTNILGIELIIVDTPQMLREHIELETIAKTQIIDTAATNPYDEAEMEDLRKKIAFSQAEPILVLAAGADPMELADMARFYGDIGVKRFITTQMDIARRAGGILAAAYSANMAFSSVSVSAKVSEPLKPISPVSLARLIMPHTDENSPHHQNTEAAQ